MQKEKNIKSRWSKNILLFVLNPGLFYFLFHSFKGSSKLDTFDYGVKKREIERERERVAGNVWRASDQRVKNAVLCAGERLTMKRKL